MAEHPFYPQNEPIPQQYQEQFERYLQVHWKCLCNVAIAQYVKCGRSAVAVKLKDLEVFDSEMFGISKERAEKMLARINAVQPETGIRDVVKFASGFLRAVSSYDPDSEMVLWFSFPNDIEYYCRLKMSLFTNSAQNNN